jgi:hypothetical protein
MHSLLRAGRSPISAAAVDGAFLSQGMEARAHNLDQYDPSPGVDSQLERIRALALRLPPSPEREALMADVDEAIASNVSEAEAELAISGSADQLVSDLRHCERNGIREVIGAKAIAQHLRDPLATILAADHASASCLTAARHLVRDAIAEIPRLMLLSTAVEHELGSEKFALLRDLTNKSGARGLQPLGATEERSPAPHGEL